MAEDSQGAANDAQNAGACYISSILNHCVTHISFRRLHTTESEEDLVAHCRWTRADHAHSPALNDDSSLSRTTMSPCSTFSSPSLSCSCSGLSGRVDMHSARGLDFSRQHRQHLEGAVPHAQRRRFFATYLISLRPNGDLVKSRKTRGGVAVEREEQDDAKVDELSRATTESHSRRVRVFSLDLASSSI